MGEQLNGVGEMDLHLQIGTHQVSHSVLMVTQILQQCLLGTDYLEKQMLGGPLEWTLTAGGHIL